jgi:hypothetical protein
MKSLTVKFKDALGNPLRNGRCFLKLSQDSVALSDAQIAPSLISIQLDVNGAATQLCYFNDELSPANTTYQITALEVGGGLVYGPESFSITGPSFNLNTAQPTTLNVMLANPVLQNPTAAQTIAGFNLIISGAQILLADGTAAVPGVAFNAEPGTGLSRLTSQQIAFSINTAAKMLLDTSGLRLSSTIPIGWSANTNPFVNSNDTAFSRTGVATTALGNGNQSDASGLLKLSGIGINGANPSAGAINAGTGTNVMASGTTVQTLTNTAAGTQMTIVSFPKVDLTLANGANNDVSITGATMYRIIGPSAGFSISGFTGGADGRVIYVFNSVTQQMTITNNAGSTASNRITTLTGADVVLRAGTSFATFIYDTASSRWILVSTN